VWLDAAHPNQAWLSLHQLGPGYDVSKQRPPIVQAATVHGQAALWTEGPYPLEVRPSSRTDHYLANRWLVRGHVLIWQEGAITYRLETDRSLDEAVRIAESLR
jgi:hypothetical protein